MQQKPLVEKTLDGMPKPLMTLKGMRGNFYTEPERGDKLRELSALLAGATKLRSYSSRLMCMGVSVADKTLRHIAQGRISQLEYAGKRRGWILSADKTERVLAAVKVLLAEDAAPPPKRAMRLPLPAPVKENDMDFILPSDIYKGAHKNKLTDYGKQVDLGRAAIAKRIDLAFQLLLEVNPSGETHGFLPAVMQKFNELGRVPSSQTLADEVKIFRVLRLPALQGMGLTHAEIAGFPFSRMRVLAQNAKWTLAHQEEALEMLRDSHGSEAAMRDIIAGPKPPNALVTRQIKLNAKGFAAIDKALSDVAADLEKQGKEVPANQNELLLTIIAEWRKLKKAAK